MQSQNASPTYRYTGIRLAANTAAIAAASGLAVLAVSGLAGLAIAGALAGGVIGYTATDRIPDDRQ